MVFSYSSRIRKRKCTISFDSEVISDSPSEKKPKLTVSPIDLPVPSADYSLSLAKPAISLQELSSLSTFPPSSTVTALSSISTPFPSLLPVPHASATMNATANQHTAVIQPPVFSTMQSMPPPPPPNMLSGMLPLSAIPPKPSYLEEAIDPSTPSPGGEGELQSMLPPPPTPLVVSAAAVVPGTATGTATTTGTKAKEI